MAEACASVGALLPEIRESVADMVILRIQQNKILSPPPRFQ